MYNKSEDPKDGMTRYSDLIPRDVTEEKATHTLPLGKIFTL
jgi:hypothetical protein